MGRNIPCLWSMATLLGSLSSLAATKAKRLRTGANGSRGPLPVIASEAKQSIVRQRKNGLLRRKGSSQ